MSKVHYMYNPDMLHTLFMIIDRIHSENNHTGMTFIIFLVIVSE